MATERRHRGASIAAYVALVLALAFGQWRFVSYVDDQRAQDRQQAVDADYRSCLFGNSVRGTLRALVNLTGSTGIDLTQVPGFADLDPATQRFFRTLRDRTANDPQSFRTQALATLQDRDCDTEFPTHSPGIPAAVTPSSGPPTSSQNDPEGAP